MERARKRYVEKMKRILCSIVSVLFTCVPVPPFFPPRLPFIEGFNVAREVTGSLFSFVIIGHDLAH